MQALARLRASIEASEHPRPELLVAWASLELTRTGLFLEDLATGRSDPILEALKAALLIDERFAPTYDRLAIYYLHRARLGRPRPPCSGGFAVRSGLPPSFETRRPAGQRIELARQAYLMGLAIDPNSASLHNTAALVEAEDEQFDVAAREIVTALRLQPSFAEAQLNMGALALRARDFPRAESAYLAAVALLPESYDAHLGLAVAKRGRLGPDPSPDAVREIQHELLTCDELDSTRPEAAFNMASLFEYLGSWPRANTEAWRAAFVLWNEAADRGAIDSSWYDGSQREALDRAGDLVHHGWQRPTFLRPPRLLGQCTAGRL